MQCCRFVSVLASIFLTFSVAVYPQQVPGAAAVPNAATHGHAQLQPDEYVGRDRNEEP